MNATSALALNGKRILVTGGSSGIGAACVREFVHAGARVLLASVQQEEGDALARELTEAGGEAAFFYCDVSDESSVAALLAEAGRLFGGLDGVHCNAGVWAQGTVEAFDLGIWEKVMGVNLRGVLWTAKHAVPLLCADDRPAGSLGTFLVTTSVASQIGFPQHAVYCASKAACEAVIRCMATDCAGRLRVLGISPGTIRTPMLAATCEGWDKPVEELYAEVARKIPVRRLGEPEDIAKTARFLLSDEAGYLNGTIVTLDGGTMALPPW